MKRVENKVENKVEKKVEKRLRTIIAKNIKKFRLREGLTQDELGYKLGYKTKEVAKNMIYFYESMKRSPGKKTLERLAEALNVNVEEFFYRYEEVSENRKFIRNELDGTDMAMARICENLIDLLCKKGYISFDEFPLPNQEIISRRKVLRVRLRGTSKE